MSNSAISKFGKKVKKKSINRGK